MKSNLFVGQSYSCFLCWIRSTTDFMVPAAILDKPGFPLVLHWLLPPYWLSLYCLLLTWMWMCCFKHCLSIGKYKQLFSSDLFPPVNNTKHCFSIQIMCRYSAKGESSSLISPSPATHLHKRLILLCWTYSCVPRPQHGWSVHDCYDISTKQSGSRPVKGVRSCCSEWNSQSLILCPPATCNNFLKTSNNSEGHY